MSAVFPCKVDHAAHLLKSGAYLRTVSFREVFQTLVARDEHREVVFVAVIDNKVDVLCEPVGDILYPYIVQYEQLCSLHIVEEFRVEVFPLCSESLLDTIRDIS